MIDFACAFGCGYCVARVVQDVFTNKSNGFTFLYVVGAIANGVVYFAY